MSTSESPTSYTLGPTHPRTQGYATFESKPDSIYGESRHRDGTIKLRRDTGAGYERWRSYEYRPETPGQEKEDVYASVSRLTAVAVCYPDDMDISDILDHLDGRDVHHTTGVKWCNFGESPNFDAPGLQVVDHGRHSGITQAQMRAWAEDSKRQAQIGQVVASDGDGDSEVCPCGAEAFGTTESLDNNYCHPCLVERVDGETIEVL